MSVQIDFVTAIELREQTYLAVVKAFQERHFYRKLARTDPELVRPKAHEHHWERTKKTIASYRELCDAIAKECGFERSPGPLWNSILKDPYGERHGGSFEKYMERLKKRDAHIDALLASAKERHECSTRLLAAA